MATNAQCQSAAMAIMVKFDSPGGITEQDAVSIIQEYCVVSVDPVEKKKRGRPAGSKNKNKKKKTEASSPKRSNLYKTLKREQAAIQIQQYARRFIVDYQILLSVHTH